MYIMANKNKLKPKGHLYISSPTLESLVLLCENAKETAHISGIEYSNFLKACKMEKDIRFTPVRDKDLLRIAPIAYSFQYALAVPRAYSRRNSMLPVPHRDS